MSEAEKQEVLPPVEPIQDLVQPRMAEQRVVIEMPSRKALNSFVESMPRRRFAVIDTHSEEGVLFGPYQRAEQGKERKVVVVDTKEEAELELRKFQGIRGAADFKIVEIDPRTGKQLSEN